MRQLTVQKPSWRGLMRAHRFVWWTSCAGLTFVGFGVAVHWPSGNLFWLFMIGTWLMGTTTLQYNVCALDDGPEVPRQRLLSNVATNAFCGGAATVAFAGLEELLGPWVLASLVFVALSSPPMVRSYGRWLVPFDTRRFRVG